MLFFAKNKIIFDAYKTLQNEGKVDKAYYADLQGKLDISKFKSTHLLYNIIDKKINISSPIYHHKSIPSKMTLEKKHQRGKAHEVETLIEPLYYNSQTNSTTCKILIKKGIRHQIRIHTASMGHPVVGDKLYCPKTLRSEYTKSNTMHLRSVGIEIKK